jgi:phosphoribosylamine--glycine ligase
VKVLVIGSGGREHALCEGLLRDPGVAEVHAAPGNAGIAQQVQGVHPVSVDEPETVGDLAQSIDADLVVVGPEAPLVAGVADELRERGIACFGPSASAAQIEGSKAFAKQVMALAGVPTAMAHVCDTRAEVEAAVDAFGPPYVVKDDGLAAGKGVVVTTDRDAALAHAAACGRVLVEEYLDGPEVSLFCITDGSTVVPLQPAQDFKRAHDGDEGPNTGGMGAYTPLPWAPDDLVAEVVDRVVEPTILQMRRQGTPYCGLLYVGLALTSRGLRVVEFNARFGDPETQPILARLLSPLGHVLHAAATSTLETIEPLCWSPDYAVTVVLASENYPARPVLGDAIVGLDAAQDVPGVTIQHAGTARAEDGGLVTSGGRVLAVTASAPDLEEARGRAYEAMGRISVRGSHYRRDIAAVAAGVQA